jgi:hypothetical protein
VQPDYDHFEKSFILKTRRIEYTFNHFRVKEKENVPQSLKEISDEMFVDEMRFQTARIYGLSYLIGFNSALAAYFLMLRPLKLYLKLPLTFVAFFLAKNFAIGYSIDRIYYPL